MELSVEDAISNIWSNCPDEMEVILDDIAKAREDKIDDIRDAKKRGIGADWVMGEMVAYKDLGDYLSRPQRPQHPAL